MYQLRFCSCVGKSFFPNEDATCLVDELYTLPAKLPTSVFQFAAWLED